jgi:hypothetical protein
MLRRKNLYYDEEQIKFLESLDTLSVSEHLRRAVDEYIAKFKPSAVLSESKIINQEKHGRFTRTVTKD